jgi:type III pantothenate kinase
MSISDSPKASVLAVCVGNTRTQVGLLEGIEVHARQSFPNDQIEQIAEFAKAQAGQAARDPAVVIASVHAHVADKLQARLESALGAEIYRVGRDLEIPILHSLDDPTTVGQDRLLNALGAFARFGQACVIIDAGTAITVDLIDGEGNFHGGAIAPGLNMMLRSLHQQTSALPELTYEAPDPARGVLGKDTRHAMLLGVRAAAVGLAHLLIDQYAEFYGGYPRVVATGGDAPTLFEKDELVEHVLPELQLLGVAELCKRSVTQAEDESEA